jgi:integrase
MRFGLVPRNVADLVDPPRKLHREMAVYDEDQARKLIAAASGDRFEALCILVLATGMRQGELLALRWSEVNLADRVSAYFVPAVVAIAVLVVGRPAHRGP